MYKDKLQFLSPLFLKYQSDFEKNPRSRVFAPLAESYRKVGMTDKAMEILSQGIRYNPSYVMGYVGLAFCYFDLKQYNLAYSTLRPLVESNRDNIRLQRLFADTCIALEHKDEALDTLKFLLFVNPRDKEVAKLVEVLETEIEQKYKPNHKPIIIPEESFTNEERTGSLFDIGKLESTPKIDFDDWLHIDLNKEKEVEIKNNDWNVKKNVSSPVLNLEKENISSEKIRIEKTTIHENVGQEELIHNEPIEETPIVTHTLVDLYCGQGHIEKAIEILEKILILNPHDKKTKAKLDEIKGLIAPDVDQPIAVQLEETKPINLKLVDESDEYNLEETFTYYDSEQNAVSDHLVDIDELDNATEEDGRRNLMNILDQKILSNSGTIDSEIQSSPKNVKKNEVEKKLMSFLQKIQQRALDYQNRF